MTTDQATAEEYELQISNSQANTYLSCPAKWSYIYRHRKTSGDTAPLRKGSYIHHLLDLGYTWVKQQPNSVIPESGFPEDLLEAICLPAQNEDDLMLKTEAGVVVMQYFRYKANFDYNWQILGAEESYYVTLTTPKGRKYKLEMHIDLLYRNKLTGEFVVVDHKSGKIWSQDEAECDPQMALYIAVLQMVGYPINQGCYNFLNTTVKKTGTQDWTKNFERRPVVKSNEEGKATLHNFGAMVDDILDRQQSSGVQFPMNRSRSCVFCSFNDVCTARIKGNPRAAKELLAITPDRPNSGNKRDEEKAEFIKMVESRRYNNLSPYELKEPEPEASITIKGY